MDHVVFKTRVLAAGIAGLAASSPTASDVAQEAKTAITCTNPVSGASWQIVIDLGKATVDAKPAKVTGAKITWFDSSDGGNYTLDRNSGDLTAIVASSTGGYFRRSRCSLGNLRVTD